MEEIRVAEIFTSHMVLQRNKPFHIFGEGVNDTVVTVTICEVTISVVVENKKWCVEFPAMDSAQPITVAISYNNEKIILEDVVFGEVFFAGGQSNMAYELCKTMEYSNYIENNTKLKMRYYHVPRRAYLEEDKSAEVHGWHMCTEENKKLFSAVAYYFTEELTKDIDCTIGIIGCNWGGTSLLSWVNEEAVKPITQLQSYIAETKKVIDDKSEEEYMKEEKAYEVALQGFCEEISQYASLEKNLLKHYHATKQIAYPWPPPLGKRSFLRPFALYESMIQLMMPFAMRGVLWYQGESDALEHSDYYDQMLKSLIGLWRTSFQDEELPFFIVQLPLFDTAYDTGGDQVMIRNAQYQASVDNKNAYTICTIDTGERDNIHPFYKREVGIRLAKMAAYHCYGKKENPYGPIFHSLQKNENEWVLSFENTIEGLYAKYGKVLGFEIEEKEICYSVEGKIIGNTICITLDQVKHIEDVVAVRYAWRGFIIATMYNGQGLPMYPFRTLC